MLTTRRKFWLIYKRLRTAFGVTLGFIVIYAAYTNNFSLAILPIAVGLCLIHLFGDLYNDYVDYKQDVRNNRKDKWIISGLVSRKSMKTIFLITLATGLITLIFTNVYIFLLGLAYSGTLILYSNPKINLRRYDFLAYALVGLPIVFFPITFNTLFNRSFTQLDFFFMFFAFSHYVYLCCQKDSTDTKDETNVFIKRGQKNASLICVFFASIASLSLLGLSTFSTILIFVWITHVFSKSLNLYKIIRHDINRTLRSRLILSEFLTPYLYGLGVLGALLV